LTRPRGQITRGRGQNPNEAEARFSGIEAEAFSRT